MSKEIAIALCLVAVFEGLVLFAAPAAWQRMAAELSQWEPRKLRLCGGIAMMLGLVLLQVVR
ncbi:MAG TPA: DUF2065 family protein [Candidatus Saccharimonadia bacterium]|nr:DUF2065 family protein [Candidatus Saccharimonadia bacterium]